MDDQFLYNLRENPPAGFEEELRQRLSRMAPPVRVSGPARWVMPKPAWLAACALTLVVVGLSFPSVRSLAQQFLDLFRVQRFVAVSVDPARMRQIAQLKASGFDLKSLLSQSVTVLKEPGQPQAAGSAALAGQMAGIEVELPAILPNEVAQEQIRVEGEGVVQFTADTVLLQGLLDSLDLKDVFLPPQLNKATVTIRLPPVVSTTYSRSGMPRATLMQAASPEVALPQGVHLPELMEIMLRILGMSLDEARQFAYSLDWRGTLLVPVPARVASFREVELGSVKGILIESHGRDGLPASERRRERGSLLLWSDQNKVYCLSGTLRSIDLVQMASSIP